MPLRSSQIGAFIVQLEKRVDELLAGGQVAAAGEGESYFDQIDAAEQLERFVDSIAEDLVANKGAAVVSVGAHQPEDVQLAALRLNKKLGNVGKTVMVMPSRSAIEGVTTVGLGELSDKIGSDIKTVWILGDNPVYGATGDIELGAALSKLDDVVYMAEFPDETAAASNWILPQAHPLESWGDVRAVNGTYGICQPQILPLLNGKSTIEIMSLLMGKDVDGESLVKAPAAGLGGELS